jgi:transcriptional regulator with XRE-family HTH domain
MPREKMLKDNIKNLRIKKGWSQQDLAVKAGLSYNAVTKLEQGAAIYPRLDTLLKLADVFNITIDELIGRKIK